MQMTESNEICNNKDNQLTILSYYLLIVVDNEDTELTVLPNNSGQQQ